MYQSIGPIVIVYLCIPYPAVSFWPMVVRIIMLSTVMVLDVRNSMIHIMIVISYKRYHSAIMGMIVPVVIKVITTMVPIPYIDPPHHYPHTATVVMIRVGTNLMIPPTALNGLWNFLELDEQKTINRK